VFALTDQNWRWPDQDRRRVVPAPGGRTAEHRLPFQAWAHAAGHNGWL